VTGEASLILVVGATGQVGGAVLRGLRARGDEVTALLRPSTSPDPVTATGARIVRGDLRDPGSLLHVADGVDCVIATANTIVPRPGERADFDGLAKGYRELGRRARRFLFLSVPSQFMHRGAPEFDAKARVEAALAAEGPPLTVVRSSLLFETWLPWLGSRLPLRGSRQATLERGYWFARFGGATLQRTLERWGVALLPGDGSARHAFIGADDVAQALVTAATTREGIGDELRLGGPEVLTWREVARTLGRALEIRIRTLRQPAAAYRSFSTLARPFSPAASNLMASMAIVATVDSAYPAEDTRRLLGREPTSVETFLSERVG
jgi:uncharacterized protein YbjT (DUF2867 family)